MVKTAVVGKTVNGATQLTRMMVLNGDRVVLVDAVTGQPPKKVITKIVDKDLHVFAEGASDPSVIVKDYSLFDGSVSISGMDASGAYVNYGAAEAGSMELGAASAPVVAASAPLLSTSAMWGIGILAVAGGVAAAAGGGGSDSATTATTTVTPDTTAPSTPVIASVATDNIVNGSENTNLVISGTGEIGATVTLAVANQTAVVDSSGNWSITVADATATFGEGVETLSVTQADIAGNTSIAATRTISIDTIAPILSSIVDDETAVTANIAGGDILYTFTFNEAVTGFTIDDIIIAASEGTAQTFTQVSSTVYTLGVTPLNGYEGNMTISVDNASYTDVSGNMGAIDALSTQVVDMAAPLFQSGTTDSVTDSITLTYNEFLNTVDMSNVSNFSIEVNGTQYLNGGTGTQGILAVGMDDAMHVTLTLKGINVLVGDTVRIAYADVTTDATPAIQDLAGNDAASFGWYTTNVI